MSKYFNDAIIGNSKILGCLTKKGELIRLYYPNIDYFQNIDTYKIGIANENKISWFDESTQIDQTYKGNTVYTELDVNDTKIMLKDFIHPNENVLVRKISLSKKTNIIIYSKLNSNSNKLVSGMVVDNALIQYCQDFYMATFSSKAIETYQVNNAQNSIREGNLRPEDYIGMSDDSAIMYKDVDEITLYITLNSSLKDTLTQIDALKNINSHAYSMECKKYWEEIIYEKIKNLKDGILGSPNEKEKKIIERTILMFELLSSKETGATLASPDVDENFEKCGRYGYCWPRDALFINEALKILKMDDRLEKFYTKWIEKAQLENGTFEQRYYSNGELAPSWGIQIDETASVLIGISKFGKCRKLENIIVKATEGLLGFIDKDGMTKECFDIWEERKGKHAYSLITIYEALNLSKKMLQKISKTKYKKLIEKIEKVLPQIQETLRYKFVENGMLIRSIGNNQTDISLLAAAVPFNIFEASNPIIKNTVAQIEKDLKLENGGYMRYKNDQYIGGNAWIISSLWLALYYIKIGNEKRAKELFDWVTNHADSLGFLPEQIEKNSNKTAWITGLSWSHAMYIIVASKLEKGK